MIHIEDELALKAKDGDRQALLEVWRKSRAIRLCASKYVWPEDKDDWESESFFAFLHALRNYNPDLGHFDSYLTIYLNSYRARFRPKDLIRTSPKVRSRPSYCDIDSVSNSAELERLMAPPCVQDGASDDTERVLSLLDVREREIVSRRFGLDGYPAQTLEQIAKELSKSTHFRSLRGRKHLSRERIRQICEEALHKIRCKLGLNTVR